MTGVLVFHDQTLGPVQGDSALVITSASGPRGDKGEPGDQGPTGPPGDTGYLVYDTVAGAYPPRPRPGEAVTFVGLANPDLLGVMEDGDIWIVNDPAAPANPDVYVTADQFDAKVDTTLSTPGPARTTVEGIAEAEANEAVNAYPFPSDAVAVVPANQISVDEFSDGVMSAGWVYVSPAGGESRVQWSEYGGALTVRNTGYDAANELHGLIRPISTMAVGDAYVTRLTDFGPFQTDYTMGGLILTDGITHGAGKQVYTLNFLTSASAGQTNDIRASTNFTTQAVGATGARNTPSGMPVWVRLVRTGASTWRSDLSYDGITWLTGSAALTYTFEPTHAGLLSSSWSSTTVGVASYDLFRRMTGVA